MPHTWPSRRPLKERLATALNDFSANQHPLLGITTVRARDTLAMQMVASLRRLDYTRVLKNRDISPRRIDPNDAMFDPERGAVFLASRGRHDEALWLIFLSTHFGKHGRSGWKRLQDVYSGLGKHTWTWARVSKDPASFEKWMKLHHQDIGGGFSNHRKYESLRPDSTKGTTAVISSFVRCMRGSPSGWFKELVKREGNDPHKIFDAAYREFDVARFGRLAKFDFFALVGRLDLAPISPGSAYLRGATGPLRGACLLVTGNANSKMNPEELEHILFKLDQSLNVGMQVMEDSICNWQKSPEHFKHFKG